MRSALMHNSMPVEDIRDVIRREVELRRATVHGLYEEIAELQSIHNLVAPINSLPPELLNMIFSCVEDASTENTDLISVTHVCRHWRDIALHAPILWTRIALKHPEGVRTFLDRSKALPLRVSLSTEKLPIVATVRSLTAEIHRTRVLRVSIPPSLALDVVTQKLLQATPKLEELFLERLQLPPGARRPTVALPEVTPMEFDGAPLLSSLILRGMRLPYLPKGPCALTNICLEGALPTLFVLLDLLERSPSLENLRIHGPFNEDLNEDPRLVPLAHLKTLDIYSFPAAGIAALLPSLELPAQTNVTLNATLDFGDDFSEVMPAYTSAAPLPMGCLQGSKRLQLVWTHHELTLQAYRGAEEFHTPALQITAIFLEPRPGPRFFGDWPLDTAQVESVVLCGSFTRRHPYDFAITTERWAEMLPALPAVRTLRVMSVGNRTLEDLVGELVKERREPLCPHLEAIEFFDVFPRKVFWQNLTGVVKERVPKTGGTLARVEFFNVEGSAAWLDGLQPLAGELEGFVAASE